jgi:hypothetical protein
MSKSPVNFLLGGQIELKGKSLALWNTARRLGKLKAALHKLRTASLPPANASLASSLMNTVPPLSSGLSALSPETTSPFRSGTVSQGQPASPLSPQTAQVSPQAGSSDAGP